MYSNQEITARIIDKAESSGASLAGIASVASILNSPSHEGWGNVKWPGGAKSALVLALVHGETEPELDWWGGHKGSPGNRILLDVADVLGEWVKKEFNTSPHHLPYGVENGGIFLKDAAVLSGLGIIGRNNLLITRRFGPRVRFRAMLLDMDLEPTEPDDFAPCEACNMPCHRACPQKAFRSGAYSKTLCNKQMETDIDKANMVMSKQRERKDLPSPCIKYCRACERACIIHFLSSAPGNSGDTQRPS